MKRPKPDKEYVSATEIARRLGIPKEIILRVIEDGKALGHFISKDGDIWFERKDIPGVRYMTINTTYDIEFRTTGKLPTLSYNWGPVLPPRRENPAP